MPTPMATAANRAARASDFDEASKVKGLRMSLSPVTDFRITFILSQIFARAVFARTADVVPVLDPDRSYSVTMTDRWRRSGHISRDQGAFTASGPLNESYSRAATPTTIATSARLKTYQLK